MHASSNNPDFKVWLTFDTNSFSFNSKDEVKIKLYIAHRLSKNIINDETNKFELAVICATSESTFELENIELNNFKDRNKYGLRIFNFYDYKLKINYRNITYINIDTTKLTALHAEIYFVLRMVKKNQNISDIDDPSYKYSVTSNVLSYEIDENNINFYFRNYGF
jgi:hypothetical protein